MNILILQASPRANNRANKELISYPSSTQALPKPYPSPTQAHGAP